MRYWNQYPPYVPVAQKRAKAEKKIKQLKKKNPDLQPVIIEGNAIAKTWWGKSWNQNLEKYADYANRIGRGRSYVRHRAVLDLQVQPGRVDALVQGSASKPYEVEITITGIVPAKWNSIKSECEGRLDSLQEFLLGKFPKSLGEIFTAKDKGLFPSPQEIKFSCSCPDWASMCKHVAAVLFGIGARLDEDPGLFFKLRKVDMNDLISGAVADKTRELLQKAEKKTSRVMEESNLSDIFGIDLDNPGNADTTDVKPPKTAKGSKSSPHKAQLEKAEKQKPVKTQKAKPRPGQKTPSDQEIVEKIIRRTRKGIDVKKLNKKTGFEKNKIRNIIIKLKRHGTIKSLSRGIYISA